VSTRVAVMGGAGFGGGEIVRLLLSHPHVSVVAATSRRLAGKPLHRAHPNLRGCTDLRFCTPDDVPQVDVLVLALPHGESSRRWDTLKDLAPRIIDMSADFRLDDPETYAEYYGTHPRPEVLPAFLYALPELNREALRDASHVATGGCNATVSILALLPLFEAGVVDRTATVLDLKVGSSEGGAVANEGSHHPLRSGVVRPYRPTGHRHAVEIEAALGRSGPARVHMSVTAVDMVRGASLLAHAFPVQPVEVRDLWSIYRDRYRNEPFIRLVAERSGVFRFPEPKILSGTNYCDIGFEVDPSGERIVVAAAIDNLMRGAAGQALQALNLMMGWDERAGLDFAGLHPI